MKAKVYFTKEISSQKMIEMYNALNKELKGNIAIKVHSGEKGNQNFLRPEFMKPIIDYVKGTVVECNTAYDGARNTTDKHEQLMQDHGWKDLCIVDIMDSDGNDKILEIPNGQIIKKNYVGNHIDNYDAMLVLSHFKGHPMGGYGGALKQLSIGVASSAGKAYIHTAGVTTKQEELWSNVADQDRFLEAMADAAKSVVDYFDGNMAYINVMCNMSVDCDCCAKAADPQIQDIGILSSLDPVALDQACIDLVYAANDEGKKDLIERIESRHGIHTIEAAEKLNIGSREYELINIDEMN